MRYSEFYSFEYNLIVSTTSEADIIYLFLLKFQIKRESTNKWKQSKYDFETKKI